MQRTDELSGGREERARKTRPGQKPRGLREELVREGRENPEAGAIQKVTDVTTDRKVRSSTSNSPEM